MKQKKKDEEKASKIFFFLLFCTVASSHAHFATHLVSRCAHMLPMVNRAILAGELPSAAARAAAAASPPQSGLMTVRSSAGSAPVCLWGMWRGSVDTEQQKSVSGSGSPGIVQPQLSGAGAGRRLFGNTQPCFISSRTWQAAPTHAALHASPQHMHACSTSGRHRPELFCTPPQRRQHTHPCTPHLDDLRAQLPAVAHQVAQCAGRVGARLLLVVRKQLDQRADRGAQRVVQRGVVEAGVADGEAGKLPAARGGGGRHRGVAGGTTRIRTAPCSTGGHRFDRIDGPVKKQDSLSRV